MTPAHAYLYFVYFCQLFIQDNLNNMKKTSTIICALLFGLFLFSGCDKIEGDIYEIIESEDVTVAFPDVDPASVYRKVLIEEFTGHRCVNCPVGHQVLESLHELYGDTLVAVGIHYGALAKPIGSLYSYDFRTADGNQIGDAFVIDAIPSAIVNRNDKQGGWGNEQWTTVIGDVDRSKVPAALQLVNEYDDKSMKLKANVKVTMLQDYANPLYLVIYVIEDGIVKPQKDGTEDVEDYVHNHVLRDALTNPFGYPLQNGAGDWKAGTTVTFAATSLLADTDWAPENCKVVAFLLDPTLDDVIQVETADVMGN